MKTILINKHSVVEDFTHHILHKIRKKNQVKKKMLFCNSKGLLPGRTEHVEIPEPAAPAWPWPPSYLHGQSGPVDLCTIRKLLVIWAGVFIAYMHLFTIHV